MSARLAIAEVSNNNTMRDFQSNPTSFLKSNPISSFLETVRHVHRNFFLTKPDSYHTAQRTKLMCQREPAHKFSD